MIRLGLMGCGTVADYGHIPAIQRTRGLALTCLYDPDAARLDAARRKFHVPHAFGNVNAFFGSDIDAVVVTSPAPAHLQNVLMAAEHGKPVLCEKPLAMTDSEAQQMIEAMAAAKLPLYIGFVHRFSPAAQLTRQLIREKAIGEVMSLRLIYLWDCHGACSPRQDPMSPNQRRLGRMIEGGPMVDCGVHKIDLARWWLGSEVTRAQGIGVWVETHEAPDHMYLHMDHECGAHTMVEMSFTYSHTAVQQRCVLSHDVIGTDGIIRYDRESRLFELVSRNEVRQLPWEEEKNFEGMYGEFERALRTGDPGNMPDAVDGLRATQIARTATEQVIRQRHEPLGDRCMS
jgi:predicted dehydrogenase